jgi:hypothetical protein
MKIIRNIIKESLFGNNENLNDKLQNIIAHVGNKYSKERGKTPQQLNSGECEDIAHDVIKKIGGETINTFIIDDGWFWSSDNISKYKTKGGEYWNVENLKKYGEPPMGYENLGKLDLDGHVWIYSNGKHYDIETLYGVDNFWNLPIYKRQLRNIDNNNEIPLNETKMPEIREITFLADKMRKNEKLNGIEMYSLLEIIELTSALDDVILNYKYFNTMIVDAQFYPSFIKRVQTDLEKNKNEDVIIQYIIKMLRRMPKSNIVILLELVKWKKNHTLLEIFDKSVSFLYGEKKLTDGFIKK